MTSSQRIEVTQGRLIDKIYTNHLVVWYTLFSVQGAAKIPNKDEVLITTSKGDINFQKVWIEHLSGGDTLETVQKLAKISACANYLKETFRITQDYCIKYKYEDKLYLEKWYRFAKILVNCLSHDMIFKFDRVNPKHLPAHYAEFSITEEMEGKHLPYEFTAQLFLDLGDEIVRFITKHIPDGGHYV
jgi:hypothetical protein